MKRYSNVIRSKYKLFIAAWLIFAIITLPLAPKLNEIVVYDVEVSLPNSEFQNAVNKLNEEFANKSYGEPFMNVLASYNYYIIIKSNDPFSDKIKQLDYKIRDRFNSSGKFLLSYYKLTQILLQNIAKNVSFYANPFYNNTLNLYNYTKYLKDQLISIKQNYNNLTSNINSTLYFIYGMPTLFLICYESTNIQDFYQRSEIAKQCVISATKAQGLLLNYFNDFYSAWISSKPMNYYNETERIIEEIAPNYLTKYFNLPDNIIDIIFQYSNLSNWSSRDTIKKITLNIITLELKSQNLDDKTINEIISFINDKEDLNDAIFNIVINNIDKFKSSININIDKRILNNYIKEIIQMNELNKTYVKMIIANITLNYTEEFNINNPYFDINKESFKKFIENIIGNNYNITIDNIIINEIPNDYPIILKENIKSSFIDEKNGIFLIIIYSNHYPSSNEVENDLKLFENIKKDYESNDVQLYITGVSMLSYSIKQGAQRALEIIIPLGLILVFIVTLIYFRSIIAALLVLLLFGISITITFGIGYIILGKILEHKVSFVSPAIVVVLVLGLCSDYAIYLLRRYKLERLEGKSKEEAIEAMTFWSARGVLTSALAVLFSYLVLSLMNIPLFGDAAIANTIGITFTMITNLVFLPSLIYLIGDKAVWPPRSKTVEINFSKICEFNERRKKELILILVASVLISLIFVSKIETVLDVPPLMPPSDVQKGALLLYSTIGSSMSPIYIYVEGNSSVITDKGINNDYLNYIDAISDSLLNIKSIKYIYTIDRPYGNKIDLIQIYSNETLRKIYEPSINRFIGKSNKGILLLIIIDKQPFSLNAIEVLKEIRSNLPRNSQFKLYIDGVTQLSYDSKSVTDAATPTILISLITIIMIILFLQLISVLIPFRLIFTILSSIAWSLALLYIIYNVILDTPIVNAVPVFLVVTMLGVGVDYDIFLLTRIREEIIKGKSDEEAIRIALEKVGATILFLGILLGGTFLLLLIPDFPLLNEIGFTIGLSVLFDAFLIIPFFVPSIMLLAKKWNWWPSKLTRR